MTIQKNLIGTGKRKCSIAQVVLTPSKNQKKTEILIKSPNISKSLSVEKFFPNNVFVKLVREALFLTETDGKYNIKIKVSGGGFSGQASACKAGISKALSTLSPENRNILRATGCLTRDARIKERKKYGLKKARKAPQFSKR